jgi:hypothetical protein
MITEHNIPEIEGNPRDDVMGLVTRVELDGTQSHDKLKPTDLSPRSLNLEELSASNKNLEPPNLKDKISLIHLEKSSLKPSQLPARARTTKKKSKRYKS